MFAGELDYATVFRFRELPDDNSDPNSVDLNHAVMACILWVVFVIVMPILFANLLVSSYYQCHTNKLIVIIIQIGLAVGDTQKEEEKATLTYLSLLVI